MIKWLKNSSYIKRIWHQPQRVLSWWDNIRRFAPHKSPHLKTRSGDVKYALYNYYKFVNVNIFVLAPHISHHLETRSGDVKYALYNYYKFC